MKTRAELAVIRAMCDKDLLFFTRFFYKELRGSKFIVNTHHKEIVKQLHALENYKLDLLNINIPPRFSKTELAAVNFIARGIGMNPSANYLYITASDELRSQTSVSIRDIVTHEYFKIMYGTELKIDQNGKNLWRTKEGGGLKTATIFGQITGFGAGIMKENNQDLQEYIRTFEGCIVMDDVNKTDDSFTENANNEKVSRVFFNTILSRKNSQDTPIINIQQRAGMSDMTSNLMTHYGTDSPRAMFMVMPVISNGVPLWEWKHNVEQIETLKHSAKTAATFQTQYMQNPVSSADVIFAKERSRMFNMDEFHKENVESVVVAVDVADQGADYLSAPFGCLIGTTVYITDWLFTNKDAEYTVPALASMINMNKADHVCIETNNMGLSYMRKLQESISSSRLIPKRNSTNKHSRIVNEAQNIRLNFVFRNDYADGSDYDLAMKQIFRYTKDNKGNKGFDDAADSLALLSSTFRALFSDRFV